MGRAANVVVVVIVAIPFAAVILAAAVADAAGAMAALARPWAAPATSRAEACHQPAGRGERGREERTAGDLPPRPCAATGPLELLRAVIYFQCQLNFFSSVASLVFASPS